MTPRWASLAGPDSASYRADGPNAAPAHIEADRPTQSAPLQATWMHAQAAVSTAFGVLRWADRESETYGLCLG